MSIESLQAFRPVLVVPTLTKMCLMETVKDPELGAGHRVGGEGIIALLERRGLRARQLQNL
jgi:hypothetical protein